MKRRWRAASLFAALAGIAILSRLGWIQAQERIALWFDQEHTAKGWRWRIFGARHDGWTLLAADSIRISSRTVAIRIRTPRLSWNTASVPYALPATVEIHASLLDLKIAADSSAKDSSAPAFPGSLRIPAKLALVLDTIELGTGPTLDSTRRTLVAHGIRAGSLSPHSLELSIDRIEPHKIALHASLWTEIDWTESDTLRASLSGLASTGCCASDSLVATAALSKADLRAGRVHVRTNIEGTRGWSDVVPALAKAPAVHRIELEAWARTGGARPEGRFELGFDSDSLVFLPGMRFQLSGDIDSSMAALRIQTQRDGKTTIAARLDADFPRKGAFWKTFARGEIRIDELGWHTNGFDHPLDGNIRIERIDRKGAALVYTTDAGTSFDASVVWKGLHWNLLAKIAPNEPWAVGWVPGLSMLSEGSATGSDSAGGAVFHITARRPRMKDVVALDSLSTRLWIGPGPHLVFSDIAAHDSLNVLRGSGDISVPGTVVRFDLHPETDSIANVRMETRFDGRVDIQASSFPTTGLPVRLPFAMPFHALLDGSLKRDPTHGDSTSLVRASLRAKPARDSLHADVELAIRASGLQIPLLALDVGGSRIEGSLAASAGPERWQLDTLRLSTGLFELTKLQGLWPGLPEMEGRLVGHFLSQRDQGVSAWAKLDFPRLLGKDRNIPLPDLLLWGERDTLHLGGWAPIAGSKAPFHLVATHLWDPTPEFRFKAFWGNLVRIDVAGSFADKKNLATTWKIDGSTDIPGTEARLDDILLTGRFDGHVLDNGFAWNAKATGERGVLSALQGNPLDLRFQAQADAKEIRIDRLSLSGARNGRFEALGSWNIPKKALSLSGKARRFRLDLGAGKRLELDSLGVWATPDSRIRLSAQNASWSQSFQTKEEKLDIGISKASLVLVQAKDWKKLSGDIAVDRLLFTKNFAQVGELLQSTSNILRRKKKTAAGSSASTPLLLDIQARSESDDIRISNNLGQAKLGFDLQVTGPSDAPLLNGFAEADPDSGRFGYLGRNFALDTLRLDWNTSPVLQGKFALSGSHPVRNNCSDVERTTAVDSADFCQLILSSQGTLDNPRLRGLTSDCATQPGDDGTVGAFVALATDCYPQSNDKNDTKWGQVVRDGTLDLAYGYGMGWFNQTIMERLRRSRGDAEWLPDSVMLTDFPVGGGRDQLGILALYHITPDMDAAGVYRHTFTQSGAATTSGSSVLADDYGLNLKYRIPFWWIEEEKVRNRLLNRVFLQLDANQGLDENSRRSTIFKPSLRYRWEFW